MARSCLQALQPTMQAMIAQQKPSAIISCLSVALWSRCLAYTTASNLSASTTTSSADIQSSNHSSDRNAESQQLEEQQQPKLYAACVLERLPILKTAPPAWEVEYKARAVLQQLQLNQLKHYPIDAKQRQQPAQASASDTSFSQTPADESGISSTMKRRLHDKLVLLVKAHSNDLTAGSSAAAATGTDSSWTFPHTQHQAGESMRQAAERALRETIGASQVYFIGNAPMAHLNVCNSSSSSSAAGQTDVAHNAAAGSPGGSGDPHLGSNSSSSSGTGKAKPSDKPSAHTVFFHLAQVVNDPWEVFLEDQVAEEFAWVAKDELEQYIRDPQLLKLAHKML